MLAGGSRNVIEVEPRLQMVVDNITKGPHPSRLGYLLSLKDPKALWEDNWFALILEITVISIFLLAWRHAKQRGIKHAFYLLSLVIAAFGTELLPQIHNTGYQLWWYHEGMINLMQHKVPLYVLCFYAVTFYFVHHMNRTMNLPTFSQAFVNACTATILVFPCLALAPNLLLMMFHFDDPVFKDRLYNVPYTELTYLMLLFFHSNHIYYSELGKAEPHERTFFKHFRCSLLSGIVSPMYSLVELYLLYVGYKLIFGQNAAFCFVTAVVVMGSISRTEIISKGQSYTMRDLSAILKRKEWLYLFAFFCFVVAIPLLVHPENLKSTGDRLEHGPCNAVHMITNMSPLGILRRRYICPNDTERFGYDFHCVSAQEFRRTTMKKHYTICGAPYQDPALVKTLIFYSAAALGIIGLLFSISTVREQKDEEPVENGKKMN